MARHHYSKRWGAEPISDEDWRFALWAPEARDVAVEIDGTATGLASRGDGWFAGEAAGRAGQSYAFRIDGTLYPDPAARAQAHDVHGVSRLIDPRAFHWSAPWRGIPWHEAVIYELHIGTLTPEGNFAAAQRELPRIKALGVTLLELMPVAQFEGRRGWGYDGVLPYSPHNAYGTPEEFKQFVAAAHAQGLGILLDVVYNHFGPAGNYLATWCPSFFHASRKSPWGQGIAYEEEAVRTFFLDNALYWLEEYQLDGLRLDAVHAMADDSPVHILDALGEVVRARNWDRPIHLVTEDERNLARYFSKDAPFDGTWNDDWHHAVHCLLTGEQESYYAPFAVDPIADIETALREGYIEQGQPRPQSNARRGEPSGHLPRTAFINFLGNHDQVGNRAMGERLHQIVSDEDALRVVTALTLLAPFTPMIFMGDEFFTEAPFLFFTDFAGDMADAVRRGRAKEFDRFSSFGGTVPDPNAPESALRSRIGKAATPGQFEHEAFVRNLLALRADHVLPLLASNDRPAVSVTREDRRIDAEWCFGTTKLLIRSLLGGDGFAIPTNPFFVEARPDSRYALAASVRKD